MTNIKIATAKVLKNNFNIDELLTALLFEKGWLNEFSCRNILIKEEYKHRIQSKEKQRIKANLAERYCMSFKNVEKIVLK